MIVFVIFLVPWHFFFVHEAVPGEVLLCKTVVDAAPDGDTRRTASGEAQNSDQQELDLFCDLSGSARVPASFVAVHVWRVFFFRRWAGGGWASQLEFTDVSQVFAGSAVLRTCKVTCAAKDQRMYVQNRGESRKFALRDGTRGRRRTTQQNLKESAASVVQKRNRWSRIALGTEALSSLASRLWLLRLVMADHGRVLTLNEVQGTTAPCAFV